MESQFNRGVLVTALDEVVVYGLNQMLFSTDGFTALQTDVIGKDYVILGYANTANLIIGGGTNLSVIGTFNNTTVTITPTATVGSRAANVPFTITMNRGQSYTLHGGTSLADLTGSTVSANQPISVFGGNTAALIPAGIPAAADLGIDLSLPHCAILNEDRLAPGHREGSAIS